MWENLGRLTCYVGAPRQAVVLDTGDRGGVPRQADVLETGDIGGDKLSGLEFAAVFSAFCSKNGAVTKR